MILVIGATGYIGRYFCVQMAENGEQVLALGRSKAVQKFFSENNVPFQHFDFQDASSFELLPKQDVEAIVDLSACLAEHETPVERFFEVNTIGAYKVLEYAYRNSIKKVVITSSHKVYNDLKKQKNISENETPDFRGDHSPYIISKIAAENFVEYYNKDFKMNAIALRLTGVRGYGEILGHLNKDGTYTKSTLEIFFEKALAGEAIECWGNQDIKRDHVYIKDVVSALLAAVRSPIGKGIYNIASGKAYSQYEEALAIARVFGAPGKISSVIQVPEKPGLHRGYEYNIEKAKRELDWQPKFVDLIAMYEDYKKEWSSKRFHNYHYILDSQKPATF